MYLHSVSRIDMHGLEKPARRVGANGDCTQVERPILLSNLLECATVAGVTSKPEALSFAQHSPAAPQRLVFVAPSCPGASMLHSHKTSL